jgi:YNFM family putative membrane transporter
VLPTPPTLPSHPPLLRHNTADFRRANLAIFSAGFATFALLYCVQPLLPVFARDFHVSAAASSLSLSLTTGVLAPAMIVAGALSEARGRKSIMLWSLLASAVLTLASAFVSTWREMLILRAAAGVTFAGLPAVSMAYLSEEVHPNSLGLAIGLAIGGNGLGGMTGRLLGALLADLVSWRFAVGVVGVVGLAATLVFWRTLPQSLHFTRRPLHARSLAATFGAQLRDPRLLALFAEGFLLMGGFVTAYNYVMYHLLAPPYSLSQAVAGLIFVVYLGGVFASAWIGAMADRKGRGRMLVLMTTLVFAGVVLTLAGPVWLVFSGIAVVTFGFFGGHSVASSWVGLRATNATAQATALYMFFYYIGASTAGTIGGFFWDVASWPGVVAFVGGMTLVAIGLAAFLARPARV